MNLNQLWETAPTAEEKFQHDRAVPERVQCYLQSAIAPNTPLASAVWLKMHGEIKLNNWFPFRAEQVIHFPKGLIWNATVWMRGLPIRGFDRVIEGEGKMQWKLLGLLPITKASGENITRSALGRMIGELMWLPSVFCDSSVTWKAGDANQIQAQVSLQGETIPLTLTVNERGDLEKIQFPRWGNPDEQGYRYVDFGGIIEERGTFQGYTIPTCLRGGWYFDGEDFQKDGEFFRATIDEAIYRI
jgi:hypothetical protein